MARTLVAIPFGALLMIMLFLGLAWVSQQPNESNTTVATVPNFDFYLVRQDSQVEVRQRQRPPEPEEIIQQPKPEMPSLQQNNIRLDSPPPALSIPNIDVGIKVALNPSLTNLPAPVMEIAFDSNPTVLSQIPPTYPHRALRRNIQGSVTVEFTVSEQGLVVPDSIKVITSNPKGMFEKAVIRSIKRWRFKSRMVNGQAVPFRARQQLDFKLEK